MDESEPKTPNSELDAFRLDQIKPLERQQATKRLRRSWQRVAKRHIRQGRSQRGPCTAGQAALAGATYCHNATNPLERRQRLLGGRIARKRQAS